MTRQPPVTVVTACYNAAATIADTLRSVAAQDLDGVEHVVIDGASTDGTPDIVRRHARPGLRLVSEPDRGLYDAMNKGAALATGDFVGFLNADDFLIRTDALSAVARAGRAADAVLGDVVIIDRHDPRRVRRHYRATSFRPWQLRFGHMPPHPGLYARRSVIRRLGPFDPALTISADFDWMVRLFAAGVRAAPLATTLVALRDGGVSNQGLRGRVAINRQIGRALRARGVRSAVPLLWSRYLVKSLQLLDRPGVYPAPAPVRWDPAVHG